MNQFLDQDGRRVDSPRHDSLRRNVSLLGSILGDTMATSRGGDFLAKVEEIITNRHKELLASVDEDFGNSKLEQMNTAFVSKYTDMMEEIRAQKGMYKK